MPIFEFRCASCGAIKEIILSGSDAPEMKCSECQGEELVRIMSTASYSMGSSGDKGSGSGPSVTTKTCGPGNTCSSINLPGYTR